MPAPGRANVPPPPENEAVLASNPENKKNILGFPGFSARFPMRPRHETRTEQKIPFTIWIPRARHFAITVRLPNK